MLTAAVPSASTTSSAAVRITSRDSLAMRSSSRMTACFLFDADEQLVCERIYFDPLTMLRQLLRTYDVRKPTSWPKLVKAVRGLLALSGTPGPRLSGTTPPAFCR